MRLLTWGRGTEGQLGLDSSSTMSSSGETPLAQRIPQVDYHLPQVGRMRCWGRPWGPVDVGVRGGEDHC